MTPLEFVERLSKVFGPAYKDGSGETAETLMKHLAPYSKHLEAVAERIILTRKYHTWPMPVEILTHCRDAAAAAEPARRLKPKEDDWFPGQCVEADRLVCCSLGVEAAEGGWLDDLWHFCRKNKRLPVGDEIDKVFQQAEKSQANMERAFERIRDDTAWPKNNNAYKLRESLLNLYARLNANSDALAAKVKAWGERNAGL